MTLWFLFALMTAAAIFAVLWPLGRGARERRTGGDVAVYRDQLDEVARDRASGLIGEAEAEAARVEVSRRLIAAADASETSSAQPAAGANFRRRAAAVATLVALPAIGAALYLTLGSPDVPGQPIASRAAAPPQNQSLETLVARVEAHLETNPDDGRGWEVIAPVYVRLGRLEDAVKARRNALRINRDERRRADLEAELGETLIAAANGVVTQEAKAAFERAAAQDPRHPKARFFLGVAAHQDGEAARALAIWRDIARDTGTDSPWGIMARQGIASVIASVEGAAPAAPGPSAADVAASEQMDPQDRAAMIRGMVERLAERLKHDGSDVEGWLRLVRAYTVMGDRERAISAVADARRALGHDADKLRRIDALAKELKLES